MKLFDNALMTVTPLALVGIWGELLEAYHGLNGYGGHTAEIYAYRLTQYSPTVHGGQSLTAAENINREITAQAANALCAIIDEFCTTYECDVSIDDLTLDEWCEAVNFGEITFDHRCHVRIIKTEKVPA